jgi:hypothetical protein
VIAASAAANDPGDLAAASSSAPSDKGSRVTNRRGHGRLILVATGTLRLDTRNVGFSESKCAKVSALPLGASRAHGY